VPWTAIGVGLIAVAVAIAAVLIATHAEPAIGIDGATRMDTAALGLAPTAPTDHPAGSADLLVVDVGGAVLRPGVYHLPAGSRVGDAVTAAGGYAATVDAALVGRQLNLAAVIHDGDKIRVPVRGETSGSGTGAPDGTAESGGAGSGGTGGPASGGLVDLNTASADELDALPGVGPATAAKIIAAREQQPFTSVDDLLARKVVGAALLEKLRPLVRVGS
jgi:competence protein ComEA